MKSLKLHEVVLIALLLLVALLGIAGKNPQVTQKFVAPLLDLGTPDRYIPEGDATEHEKVAMRAFVCPSSVKMKSKWKDQDFVRKENAEMIISPEGYDAPDLRIVMPVQGAWGGSQDSLATFVTKDARRYLILTYTKAEDGEVRLCVGEGQFNPSPNGPVFSVHWEVEDPRIEEIYGMIHDLPDINDRHRYVFQGRVLF